MRDPMDRHEPSPEFAARLESQIAGEVRRRNLDAQAPRWRRWSPLQAVAATAAVIVISMGAGGAAVAAAYEAQNREVRGQLVTNLEQRIELARQRLDIATRDKEAAEQRFAVGIDGSGPVMEKGVAVADAQADVDRLALDLEEVRLSGREPRHELSAPRVSGRDFVGERLQVDLSVPQQALKVAQDLATGIQAKVEIGVIGPVELEVSRSRVAELEATLSAVRRKIELRKQFLSGKIDRVETELRALETEAEQKQKTLAPKVELAKQDVVRLTRRVDLGLVHPADLAEAKVRQLELETELSKVELDLVLIRRKLDEHRQQ